jgi:hypothetical protein
VAALRGDLLNPAPEALQARVPALTEAIESLSGLAGMEAGDLADLRALALELGACRELIEHGLTTTHVLAGIFKGSQRSLLVHWLSVSFGGAKQGIRTRMTGSLSTALLSSAQAMSVYERAFNVIQNNIANATRPAMWSRSRRSWLCPSIPTRNSAAAWPQGLW